MLVCRVDIFAGKLSKILVDLNQRSPWLSREDATSPLCLHRSRPRLGDMVELKIALMVALIAILFFMIYFTAIPG
jgi:hypothetical protein